jgi:hypothetical protein
VTPLLPSPFGQMLAKVPASIAPDLGGDGRCRMNTFKT